MCPCLALIHDPESALRSRMPPHAHFAAKGEGSSVFGSIRAENQGDPRGVGALDPNPLASGKKQIALMMKLMFDEGPGGGHYENMVNRKFRRVGIAVYYTSGKL